MNNTYYVYILASRRNGTLYIGVTNDLVRRVYEHKNDLTPGFTKRYAVHDLVYYEACDDMYSALQREKRLKFWHRNWKIRQIEQTNPEWKDLSQEIEPGFQPEFTPFTVNPHLVRGWNDS